MIFEIPQRPEKGESTKKQQMLWHSLTNLKQISVCADVAMQMQMRRKRMWPSSSDGGVGRESNWWGGERSRTYGLAAKPWNFSSWKDQEFKTNECNQSSSWISLYKKRPLSIPPIFYHMVGGLAFLFYKPMFYLVLQELRHRHMLVIMWPGCEREKTCQKCQSLW